MSTDIDNLVHEDIFDLRDVIARVEELRSERDESDIPVNEYGGPNDSWATERAELAELESLLAELAGGGGDEQFEGDWYPVTLIRDSHFKTYAEEFADDVGAIKPGEFQWPYTCIDWDQAARELQTDYSSVEFRGVTFWYR